MYEPFTVPFKGTKERGAQLLSWLEEHKTMPGVAMPALQKKAQEIYGYLPIEVQHRGRLRWANLWQRFTEFPPSIRVQPVCPKGSIKDQRVSWHRLLRKGSGKIYEALQQKLGITGGECTADGKFSAWMRAGASVPAVWRRS